MSELPSEVKKILSFEAYFREEISIKIRRNFLR